MAKARLIFNTPLSLVVDAMNKCVGKSDPTLHGDIISDYDENKIKRKILRYDRYNNKEKSIEQMNDPTHESVLEHVVYNFELWCSRAALQEIARHRIASMSVESTRFCLSKNNLQQSVYEIGNKDVDNLIETQCGEIGYIEAKNDIKKYALPEAVMTSMIWTINARSLRNFLNLRSRKSALKEMRLLSKAIYDEIPITHRFLYWDCMWYED